MKAILDSLTAAHLAALKARQALDSAVLDMRRICGPEADVTDLVKLTEQAFTLENQLRQQAVSFALSLRRDGK